ncbi:MAG: CtsR family transcriptional regulator [Firmicutes bacterium]|nr:CtsR family transcriptional regulator [Bacillota bacterium]
MLISDTIAKMLVEMLDKSGGTLELKRNDLAEKLGCVPSQINYVISSRFTPEMGYIVESRRGGGGYIRIIRKQMGKDEYLMHFYHAVGNNIDESSGAAFINNIFENGLITQREKLLLTAVLAEAGSGETRAAILKKIALTLMK